MEMNQETLEKLRLMRLYGMYNTFKTSMETYKSDSMTADQFLSWLVTSEWDDRCNRMIERLTKQATFRYKASIEEIDYSINRGLDKNTMERLAELTFMDEAKNLFITGCSGTGKSFIASALGYKACQKGKRVYYWNTAKLLGHLKVSKLKGVYINELKKLERAELLILDDFGIQPFDNKDRSALLDVIEDRYDRKSVIITSQVPVDGWYDVIGDQTIADAILDRIVHTAINIELYGESLRKMQSLKK